MPSLRFRWLLALCLSPAAAAAAGPLAAQGEPIKTSHYRLDIFQGPVLDTVRVTSLAGAYAPLADGVEGMRVNTAAPAVRPAYSTSSVDYDLSLGFTSPGSLKNTDFDNNGSAGFTYGNFIFIEVGGLLQWGPWGVGLSLSTQRYTLGLVPSPSAPDKPAQLDVVLERANLQLARAFFDHQLVAGVGLRIVGLTMEVTEDPDKNDKSNELVSIAGAAPEAGVLWAPHGRPIRLSLSARAPVLGSVEDTSATKPDAAGDLVVEGRYLPSQVALPWELEAGAALQLGARPLNPPWRDPRSLDEAELPPRDDKETDKKRRKRALKERYAALPRQKLLLLASLLVSGPVSNAVGVESFLSQRVDRSGSRVALTPRVAAEIEPVEGWLQVRAGSYLEPSRYRGKPPRPHGTLGLEARLFPWTVFGLFADDTWWRASGFVDLSQRYLGWGVSVGVWR